MRSLQRYGDSPSIHSRATHQACPQLGKRIVPGRFDLEHAPVVERHLQSLGMGGDRELPVLHAYDMLLLFGDVVIATLLAEQARIAHGKLAAIAEESGADLEDDDARLELLKSDDEARFYAGKIDDFRFFANQCLPRTAALLRQISSPDRTALTAVL